MSYSPSSRDRSGYQPHLSDPAELTEPEPSPWWSLDQRSNTVVLGRQEPHRGADVWTCLWCPDLVNQRDNRSLLDFPTRIAARAHARTHGAVVVRSIPGRRIAGWSAFSADDTRRPIGGPLPKPGTERPSESH